MHADRGREGGEEADGQGGGREEGREGGRQTSRGEGGREGGRPTDRGRNCASCLYDRLKITRLLYEKGPSSEENKYESFVVENCTLKK
jgi:hypothetical protein